MARKPPNSAALHRYHLRYLYPGCALIIASAIVWFYVSRHAQARWLHRTLDVVCLLAMLGAVMSVYIGYRRYRALVLYSRMLCPRCSMNYVVRTIGDVGTWVKSRADRETDDPTRPQRGFLLVCTACGLVSKYRDDKTLVPELKDTRSRPASDVPRRYEI